MTLDGLCGKVVYELNESGYTPAIAGNNADFDSFVYMATEKSVSTCNISKGKKLNLLLTKDQILSDEERRIFLLKIAEKIENYYPTDILGNKVNNDKYKKLSNTIKNHLNDVQDVLPSIDDLFKKVSLTSRSFKELSPKEQLREIIQVTENLILSDNSKLSKEMNSNNNWCKYSDDVLSNELVKKYRKKYQCFRHAKDESLDEQNKFTDEQILIAINLGLYIIKVIKHYNDNVNFGKNLN